jgi:tetratricopeptide (TPR) repeat protein
LFSFPAHHLLFTGDVQAGNKKRLKSFLCTHNLIMTYRVKFFGPVRLQIITAKGDKIRTLFCRKTAHSCIYLKLRGLHVQHRSRRGSELVSFLGTNRAKVAYNRRNFMAAANASKRVFLSHSTKDDPLVADIREHLEGVALDIWADSRRLTAGDKLQPKIIKAIQSCDYFIALLTSNAVNSPWVRKEIQLALKSGKKVIPLLAGGIEPGALGLWFDEEPVGLKISAGAGGVADAMPDLLAALDERQPTDPQARRQSPETPIADLVLRLADPSIREAGGTRRAVAVATLTYHPADGSREVESLRYQFTAPLGPIEAGELAWYLESYHRWPGGPFLDRAREVVRQLPEWGRRLYSALTVEPAREALEQWKRVGGVERRFTVLVDSDVVEGSSDERQSEAHEAAALLLSLPWELIHDGRGYLFHGARPVRVRRSLPNRFPQPALATRPPIRVLLVSPRPEDEMAGYFDHRSSARPLVDALFPLGELAEFKLLTPATFPALQEELKRARQAGQPYHVVHFDGHGVYDRRLGLGALYFEKPEDSKKIEKRRSKLVMADELAEVIRDHRVPLFFLDACQTAEAQLHPTASVAGQLLRSGVASVVAMSHSVLVETARRFVTAFYRKLMSGRRVGEAMLAGQSELKTNTFRGRAFIGELHLEDWFVPVLFQEEQDPQLIAEMPAERVQAVIEKEQRLALGRVPGPPRHGFVGRSRELLAAERALEQARSVVFRGEGGEGKTALAAELVRWLVATRRFRRAAFARLDEQGTARAVLYALGEQLVPNFLSEAAGDDKRAWQLVERALADQATVLLLDNMESVLPPAPDSPAYAAFDREALEKIAELCRDMAAIGGTRLIFTSREALTSREPMPAPFEADEVRIGRLDRHDAIALVGKVLGEGRLMPRARDAGESDEEIEKLVEAVNCHARSLVLLAGEVAASGVRDATEKIHQLMAGLHARYPNDRERSLFASVDLSLRRLPADTRQKIRPLGVFQAGGSLTTIAMALGGLQPEAVIALARQLVGVGLAELIEPGYVRFDPALAPALLSELSEQERQAAVAAWAEAMSVLAGFLNQHQHTDPHSAFALTAFELPNLLAALEYLSRIASAERVIAMATRTEQLISVLGRRNALERATAIRFAAARQLGEWSHARCEAESAAVDRLLDAGRYPEAVAAARALLVQAQAAGEQASPEAAYDLAMVHARLGRALNRSGASAAALESLGGARRRFEALAMAGGKGAAPMASGCLSESADCLLDLGRLDEAADLYEEAARLDAERGDRRDVAVNKGQLGTVRMLQRRYSEALAAWVEARDIFERLGEPGSVATAWHQIGMVHGNAGQYDAAERAFQEALRIWVQAVDRLHEGETLAELGSLYGRMGRREDAARICRQAADILADFHDLRHEGAARSNAANQLVQLQRYDEARRELTRAIECRAPFGHAAELWKTFQILCNLERAVGNEAAAASARDRAFQAYLAYRRDRGENLTSYGKLFAMVAQAIADGQTEGASSQLAAMLRDPDLPAYLKPLIPALQAILAGSRDPALAADPHLDYDDAAEILLLLESLAGRPASQSS